MKDQNQKSGNVHDITQLQPARLMSNPKVLSLWQIHVIQVAAMPSRKNGGQKTLEEIAQEVKRSQGRIKVILLECGVSLADARREGPKYWSAFLTRPLPDHVVRKQMVYLEDTKATTLPHSMRMRIHNTRLLEKKKAIPMTTAEARIKILDWLAMGLVPDAIVALIGPEYIDLTHRLIKERGTGKGKKISQAA